MRVMNGNAWKMSRWSRKHGHNQEEDKENDFFDTENEGFVGEVEVIKPMLFILLFTRPLAVQRKYKT